MYREGEAEEEEQNQGYYEIDAVRRSGESGGE
jgi:hypothetical protein